MGVFDKILCEQALPDDCPMREFQTKSLACSMDTYRLTNQGRLLDAKGLDTGIHRILRFYASDSQHRWWEYEAKFSDGQLVHLLPAVQALYDADGLLRRPASATDKPLP
jgi:hypothetical protein